MDTKKIVTVWGDHTMQIGDRSEQVREMKRQEYTVLGQDSVIRDGLYYPCWHMYPPEPTLAERLTRWVHCQVAQSDEERQHLQDVRSTADALARADKIEAAANSVIDYWKPSDDHPDYGLRRRMTALLAALDAKP